MECYISLEKSWEKPIFYQQNYSFWVHKPINERHWNDKKNHKQMENDEFDVEKFDKKLMLELPEFSTILLLYMTEVIQKDNEFYRRARKNNGMSIAWDVFGVCETEWI